MDEKCFFTFRESIRNTDSLLTPAEEDYLEMIYRIYTEKNNQIRVNDLASRLNVKPPSVTKMIKKLYLKELIHFEKYGQIKLLEKGILLGHFLFHRHIILEKFLVIIKSNVNLTYETEKIEHTISNQTLEKITLLVDFFEHEPDILKKFHDFM